MYQLEIFVLANKKPKPAEEPAKLKIFGKWKCDVCDLTFSSRKEIDKHYRDPNCLKIQKVISDVAAGKNGNQL